MMTPVRLCCAAAATALWLLLCAWAWLRHRHSQRNEAAATRALAAPHGADAVLVLHASQTGLAEQLAGQTAQSLRAGGLAVQVAGLGAIDAERLRAWPRALFVASTYGEGDPPDAAAAFAGTVMREEGGEDDAGPDLRGLRYAVLALGDSNYAEFCGFGRRLDHWLHRRGAQPLFDRVDVDRGDPAALRHWQRHLALLAGRPDLPDWEAPAYRTWRLAERVLLNPGSAGPPCYHLALVPADGELPDWQAGDIAEIGPRAAVGGELLPHREYSIASLPADGAVHLLVRQMRREDGSLGAGSGWLTRIAPPGAAMDVRLRSNRGFHPPPDDRPLILVGNGTGLAGLRALIKARAAAGRHRNWLVFGERSSAHDAFYRDDITAWRAAGVLERVDAVFSRDPPGRRYVQHALADAADDVRRWIAGGAAVYVCGSLHGMAAGVDDALAAILGRAALDELARSGRYRRDVY